MKNVILAVCMTALGFSGALNYAFLTGKFARETESAALCGDYLPKLADAAEMKRHAH